MWQSKIALTNRKCYNITCRFFYFFSASRIEYSNSVRSVGLQVENRNRLVFINRLGMSNSVGTEFGFFYVFVSERPGMAFLLGRKVAQISVMPYNSFAFILFLFKRFPIRETGFLCSFLQSLEGHAEKKVF